jgi:hypothetical protein
MGLRATGKHGQIWVPMNDGIVVSNATLTKQASYTIAGTAYADRVYINTNSHWNRNQPISVTIQGIVGEASVTPTGVNNEVQTTAAISYYKDDTSGLQTAAIDSSITVTRPAGAVAKWNLIVLNTGTGAISAVAGTDSADTTFLETFGSGAGQIPLVAVNEIVIAAVKLTSASAAPVTASEVVYTLSTGKVLQERSDIPSYEILPMEGGVILSESLNACHTGAIPRLIYASFTSQKSSLQPIAHTTKWGLNVSSNTIDLPAQGDVGAQSDLSGPPSWSVTFARYSVDSKLFKLAMNKRTGFVRLYHDRNDPKYYEGAVLLTGFTDNSDQASAMASDLTCKGDGTLEFRE